MPSISIRLTKKSFALVELLHSSGAISTYHIYTLNGRRYVSFTTLSYKGKSYFRHLKIVSTPTQLKSISLKALRLANKSLGNSIIFLETDKGIITHTAAMKLGLGGRILGVLS